MRNFVHENDDLQKKGVPFAVGMTCGNLNMALAIAIWLTAFLVSFCFVFLIVLLNVFVWCGDHAPFLNLFIVTFKNLGA